MAGIFSDILCHGKTWKSAVQYMDRCSKTQLFPYFANTRSFVHYILANKRKVVRKIKKICIESVILNGKAKITIPICILIAKYTKCSINNCKQREKMNDAYKKLFFKKIVAE